MSNSFAAGRISMSRALVALVLAVLGLTLLPIVEAQITRVANTTLAFPQAPQTFGFRTEVAFSGLSFNQPIGLAAAPGEVDRLFVIEKPGRIQVVTGVGSAPAKQLFFDLTSRVLVSDSTEEGLLGLAFHPNFAANRYFYVFYTVNYNPGTGTTRHDRLSRFTATPGATNAEILATEVPMISQRDEASNHNGGDLHFGPDGYLYVALGDEGAGDDTYNNSQRIDKDYFSGMLRVDVDRRPGNLSPNSHPAVHANTYSVPADNPFVGATSFNGSPVTPANVRTEFWAVGLRNPWRFSIDAPTGRILVGDVGQGAREEIDLITKGGNYGWNYREGLIARPGSGSPPAGASFINPLWDADRNTASSITGGMVYRGNRFAQLFERYVFGDYGSGRIFAMTFPATGPVTVQQITTESGPAGFGLDPSNGDVLIASISTGAIRRLVYNTTPTGTPLPATLSATGAFTNLASLTTAAGVVAYEPNVSFWSDHATKRRWFSVPALADKITFAADGNWTFPTGTVWVKHFELELTRGDSSTARRLETRFLVKTAGGAYGVTYKWNAQQTEATLVAEAGEDESITINDGGVLRQQIWRYPSRAECLQCHTNVAGHALSFNTAQLNRPVTYGAVTVNQLEALAGAGYFTASIPAPANLRALAAVSDNSATLEHRARSYLAANCVQCHQPGGAAQGFWDARIATPTASAGLLNGPLINPGGDGANRVVVMGDPGHSMLLTRISQRGAGQMPPLASNEIDRVAVDLITSWIAGTVATAPAFTVHPANLTRMVGNSATFTANASGTPSPTYQWRRNEVNIPGATNSSYTISSAHLSDAGSYTVVASNSAGSVTSNAALLAITAPARGDFNLDGMVDASWQTPAAGQRSMWLIEGTSYIGGDDIAVVDFTWRMVAAADFNGDGKADILWQNSSSGQRYLWLMNGTAHIGDVDLGVVDLLWTIVGAGDFNGDGKADILWQNNSTGQRVIWFMNGTTHVYDADLGVVDLLWTIAGADDFNGDGKADILWQNSYTGQRVIWFMNGGTHLSDADLGVVDISWTIAGAGDFNSDGRADILWQNISTGQRVIWFMNGGTHLSDADLGVVDMIWTIATAADFNGDGNADILWQLSDAEASDFNKDSQADILWQNNATGERVLWFMRGINSTGGISLASVDPSWSMVATADFNSDGHTDIFWQNTVTGQRLVWLMHGTMHVSDVLLGFVPTSWSIVAAVDFTGDKQADLLWQNTTTGQRVIWIMDHGVHVYDVDLGDIDTNWSIAGAADFNSDGQADILWQNTTNGARRIWVMARTTHAYDLVLTSVNTNWSIAAVADYNDDKQPDLVWQNLATGERRLWLMVWAIKIADIDLGAVDSAWSIVR